ncbi:T9SS type A sorting domain-containing protein [Aureibaculum sp. A20]|uniref:T9SS type A sorting domain-containing protein n=1 Tax=Aureibaculum flavum TaxID=2795986 RepID=A0ABS0WSL6_9FLAO|nr:alpha-amylase family glycosyl hydrolase [Aureibaculum flavum]MBJ2174976.1 T9SS type A sorting domain-containing protein [Aureibaculum flavum]
MKKILLLLLLFASNYTFAQVQNVTYTITPSPFEETDEITITVTDVNPSTWGVTDIYLWAWSTASGSQTDSPTNGTWTSSNEAQKMTKSGDSYSITFTPSTFYGRTGITSIGFLVKAKDGKDDKKSQDNVVNVGTITVPTVTEAPVPAGMLDGFNLDASDNTKATLVLYAPGKQFVNLIGSMNNWTRDDTNYLLKKDSSKDRFWIELTGLTPQTNILYQYLVDGLIRIADPYSTTILDESNDQYINSTTYPNLPAYPAGLTTHAVTLLRTGDSQYAWQNTNFQAPPKTDLVIYELLIRDFDALHSFDAVKARLDYLQDLGINAIELMPVNEFDGNESWGYNPSFHMALDKYYGSPTAFKQLIDECHNRGIAVVLDVVYNHASGQNPFYRMWNTDNGGYGGQASTDSPFFNQEATHAYSVFNDFNHSKQATKDYVKRTTQYWIDEYKIDGFRWDLTKGFTQNCTSSDEGCTGSYQADRVAVLKTYADYQWEIDTDFYVIFEHLGGNTEETEWVNYRLDEGKGIMLWSNLNGNYSEATMGYNADGKSDISWIDYRERGWTVPANVTYMESHDEERVMYKNLEFGNSSGSYSTKTLATALDRMELAGAFYFTIPGPKMIWQFGELGYDIGIDEGGRTGNKPILWNYYNEPDRKDVYDTWSKLIKLKKEVPIFKTNNFDLDVANSNGLKKIHLTDDASNPDIKHITIIGNFGLTTQIISPEFQQTGTWYDLLNDNQSITVVSGSAPLSLQPGEFKVYGTSAVTLGVDNVSINDLVSIYPNPITDTFKINTATNKVAIFDISGRMVKSFNGNFEQNKSFDISDLRPAIYFVKLQSELGFATKKLIKQ